MNKPTLPEWVTEKQSRGITHRDLTQVIEALQIAWEALAHTGCDCYPQSLSGSHTSKCNFAQANDAMRRIGDLGNTSEIEELGKSKEGTEL